MTDNLDDFLENDTEAEPEQQQEVVAEEEAEVSETVETEEAPTAPEEDTKEPAPETIAMSAYMGIKGENKELKAKIEALESQMQPKESIDIFDDPEGYKKEVLTTAQQIALNTKFDTSEMLMREKHDDYDVKADQFADMVKQDQSLYVAMLNSNHPAKFIYDHVVKTEQMKEFDNIDALKEKLRAELEAELEEKYKSKPNISPSMVDSRSSSAPKAGDQVASLDDILNS